MRDERGSYYRAWDQNAKGWTVDLEKARADFEERATVGEAGVVRWKSNGSVPPLGIRQHWQDMGLPFSFEASEVVGRVEMERALEEYRARPVSAEARMEARAAHGPGVELVDIISGRRWTT